MFILMDDSDSYEHTTERLTSSELKHEKIISSDETTPKWVKRSDEINPSTNVLIENPKPIEFNKESEERREEATTSKWVKRSDEIYPSDHVLIAKPKPVEINKESQEKREDEIVTFDFTTIEIPSEDSKVERNIDTDLYATVESSTEFNGRASRFVQNEPIVTAFTEPTSSFESFADTTGLLHTRTIPETFEHKNEGTFEEDNTTFKSDH
ncbi:hypothetical protein I4U23_003405 [Adineta vaga]|nr:hypothetical protein I4U23_003405 [Adineta vaga]